MILDTRTRILDAVGEAIEADGPLTHVALAKRAGVSRQTLYTHFPTRGGLLAAYADRARDAAGAEALAMPVYQAATALDALEALVDFHLAFTPRVMKAAMVIERERAADADVERDYGARPSSRRHFVGHVMTRLEAEGALDAVWTAGTATDLADRLLGATVAHDLLVVRGWSVAEARLRLLHVLRRALIRPSYPDNP